MTAPVRFTVPGKPAGQNRNGWNGGAWTKPPAARAFAAVLATHGTIARRRAKWETTKAPVEVGIRIFFADERPDTDAPVKAILDALEVPRPRLRRPGAGFVANDRQVKRYLVDRDVDRERPRVEVAIGPLGSGAALSLAAPLLSWEAADVADEERARALREPKRGVDGKQPA